jgi:endonuclease/exonuclease/phosphatase family metal-dependent hydrolase
MNKNRRNVVTLAAVLLAAVACSEGPTEGNKGADQDVATEQEKLRVITFNIMCSTACERPKEYDKWKDRIPHQQQLLAEYDADIIGLQELMPKELALFAPDGDEVAMLVAKHPEYVAIYWQATEADAQFTTYPDAVIYLRKSRLQVLEQGSYWLGPTPNKPLSGGYLLDKPTLPRVMVWAHVLDKVTGKKMYVANSHYDPNTPSQEHAAVDTMKRLPADRELREHAIITGDFNANPSRDAFKTLTAKQADGVQMKESRDIALTTKIAHNDDKEPVYETEKRIDHIFVGPAWTASNWTVDMRRFGPNNRHPSDHFLIVADLLLN